MLKTINYFGEFKSVKFSRGSKMKSFASVFVLLMLASTFLVLSSSTTPVKAQTVGSTIPSNLLQYGWTNGNSDPQNTYFVGGPGPTSFNVAWKVTIPGIAYTPKGSYEDLTMTAFNGYVFVSVPSMTSIGGTYKGRFFAFDGGTGDLVWSTAEGTSGAATKIDDTYMMMGGTCVKIADGSVVWKSPTGLPAGNYIPELKMFCNGLFGFDLPDPTIQPTLVWNITDKVNVGQGPVTYGNGKIFAVNQDFRVRCIDARTGNILWTTLCESEATYGCTYADGKLFWGGLDNTMYCWDANTGGLLWTYNPHTYYGQWASGCGYAYGIVYEHNQDNFMYAINATTGKLIWRQEGPGIWYSNKFSIADGKIYVQMGEKQYRDFTTGEFAQAEYDCYDAYTGKLLWTAPFEVGAGPAMQQCNAYGNLYVSPTKSYAEPGVYAGSDYIGELWCISSKVADYPMFLGSPSRTTMGSGPTNLQLKWSFEAGGPIISSAACSNEVVYFGSSDQKIYAVDANTGTQKWTFTTGFAQWSTPAVANGKVYTGSDDGNVYCLDAATGTQVWKTAAGGVTNSWIGIGFSSIRSSPAVLDGKVYVGALDGNLYCLDSNSGSVNWKFMGTAPCNIYASPTIYNNEIYLASSTGGYNLRNGPQGPKIPDGDFYKLDLNGNVIWHKVIPYNMNSTSLGNWFFATPTIAPELGLVFLRNGYRETYGISMSTGAIIWDHDGFYNPGTPQQAGGQPQTDAPCYAYGVVYIGNFYDVSALNATNGETIWDLYLSREINHGGITYSYNQIYFATETGALYVVDAETGAKLSYHEFGTQTMRSTAVPYNGNLYIGCTDSNMVCFGEARVMSAASPAVVPTVSPVVLPSVLPAQTTLPSIAPQPTSGVPTTTYIAIAAVVVIIAVIAAALVLRRRK
jgi:outer membrane protein assembly factor BamB